MTDTIIERQVDGEVVLDHLAKFSMRGLPLISQGTINWGLVDCENLWITAKVYCDGGENALHAHSNDDHAFFVLGGSAVFYDKDGNETAVGPLDGILIPRNTQYRFRSVPTENLVILRVAGAAENVNLIRQQAVRYGPDGSVLDSRDPRNHPGKAVLPVLGTGEVWGAEGKFDY
jgi:mannose-6-phosphate isomerase-like protein (cupin superfamily)